MSSPEVYLQFNEPLCYISVKHFCPNFCAPKRAELIETHPAALSFTAIFS